jgi:hypothetical protein
MRRYRRKETFLAPQKSVTLELAWQKHLSAGFFGGDGFILQKVKHPIFFPICVNDCLCQRSNAVTEFPAEWARRFQQALVRPFGRPLSKRDTLARHPRRHAMIGMGKLFLTSLAF